MQVNTTYRDIWKMAYPVMLGSIAVTVLNITDTIYLGRIGEVELGASALAGVYYFVMAMIGVAIGIGTQIQIARRTGEKNDSAIGEIFDHSVLIFLALAVVEFIILKFLSTAIFGKIIESEELRVACKEWSAELMITTLQSVFNFVGTHLVSIFCGMLALESQSILLIIAA